MSTTVITLNNAVVQKLPNGNLQITSMTRKKTRSCETLPPEETGSVIIDSRDVDRLSKFLGIGKDQP